ncbi:hypothetical protein KC363_g120 [Hortaea werneckii]|nr:hypothetical protein KC363_g120 [Hortaea werneckii]
MTPKKKYWSSILLTIDKAWRTLDTSSWPILDKSSPGFLFTRILKTFHRPSFISKQKSVRVNYDRKAMGEVEQRAGLFPYYAASASQWWIALVWCCRPGYATEHSPEFALH